MKRSCGWPRKFSFITTPLIRNRLSKLIAPEIMIPVRSWVDAVLLRGPFAVTPGASSTTERSVRSTGSLSTVACFRLKLDWVPAMLELVGFPIADRDLGAERQRLKGRVPDGPRARHRG